MGLYSLYFVIPKRGGGLRPILDLPVINRHLKKYKFKMLSIRMLCQNIQHEDWFTSVDLQDAYFQNVSFRMCLRLLGLMASTVSVVPLGLLKMRDFQNWTSSQGICPKSRLSHRVQVSPECTSALYYWRALSLLRTGYPLGPIVLRKVVMKDASLTGWGTVFEGRTVRGVWCPALTEKLLTEFLALRHFVHYLKNHNVLVRIDNTSVIAYINRQAGVCSGIESSLHRCWGI